MRYIRKTGTQHEATGRQQTKAFVDSCWHDNIRRYVDLRYDRKRMGSILSTLVVEQEYYCCYCMRRLYAADTADGHKANVTLEHIVPHNITESAWKKEKTDYHKFPNLDDRHITVCYKGELSEKQQATKLTRQPYPHFISYHNLVASCDGTVFENDGVKKSRCCNNKRQERFVMPIYLKPELVAGIGYTPKGELDYDDNVYKAEWFDEKHLNLTNAWITLVRRIWYKIYKSGEYTVQDIDAARLDTNLRQDIIDDIDSANEICSWDTNDKAWNLLSEYSWFYQYYKEQEMEAAEV